MQESRPGVSHPNPTANPAGIGRGYFFMSTRIHGRRRAVTVQTGPLAKISKKVAGNAGGVGRQAAVIAAASGMVLTSGIAAQAGQAPVQRESAPASSLKVSSQVPAPLNADSSVRISFERPAVATAPAPVIEKPAPVIEKLAPVIEKPAAAVEAPRPAVAVPAPAATAQITVQPQAAAAPAAAPQAAGGVNAVMLSSAYAQLGITQDCTRLVEKALGAAGIPAGDIGRALCSSRWLIACLVAVDLTVMELGPSRPGTGRSGPKLVR
jgi:hypothetical protein